MYYFFDKYNISFHSFDLNGFCDKCNIFTAGIAVCCLFMYIAIRTAVHAVNTERTQHTERTQYAVTALYSQRR